MNCIGHTIIKLTYLKMKNQNNNHFRCKSILFYLFIATLIAAIVMVTYFKDIFYYFACLSMIYALSKYLQMIFIMVHVNKKYSQAMHSFRERQAVRYSCGKEVSHIFVLPNYNEEQAIIKQTLENLAKHSRASKYCIFLAMEHHELNSEEKAKKICQQFRNCFKLISYTVHHLSQGQSKTKASNINWCARHMVPKLIENGVNIDSTFITIMDSDSMIPEAYVDQYQKHIQENYENKHAYIYQPPQFFTRNEKDVAFFVRVIDNLMSAMHCSQHYSFFNYTLAVSNYTISYRLLERIGFWDTCKFSKGQDIRIASKALFMTNGESQTCPIYVPINQMSLSTHEGYWADFKARMTQAKRHAQDQTELSYNLVNLFSSTKNIFKKAHALFTVCEVYLMPSLIPIPILICILQDVLQIVDRSSLDNGNLFYYFNNATTILMFILFSLFELLKRRASKELYGIEEYKFHHLIEAPLLQIPAILTFGLVPLIVASYNMLTDNITFTVAQKRNTSTMDGKNGRNSQRGSLFQPELQEGIIIEDMMKQEITQ